MLPPGQTCPDLELTPASAAQNIPKHTTLGTSTQYRIIARCPADGITRENSPAPTTSTTLTMDHHHRHLQDSSSNKTWKVNLRVEARTAQQPASHAQSILTTRPSTATSPTGDANLGVRPWKKERPFKVPDIPGDPRMAYFDRECGEACYISTPFADGADREWSAMATRADVTIDDLAYSSSGEQELRNDPGYQMPSGRFSQTEANLYDGLCGNIKPTETTSLRPSVTTSAMTCGSVSKSLPRDDGSSSLYTYRSKDFEGVASPIQALADLRQLTWFGDKRHDVAQFLTLLKDAGRRIPKRRFHMLKELCMKTNINLI